MRYLICSTEPGKCVLVQRHTGANNVVYDARKCLRIALTWLELVDESREAASPQFAAMKHRIPDVAEIAFVVNPERKHYQATGCTCGRLCEQLTYLDLHLVVRQWQRSIFDTLKALCGAPTEQWSFDDCDQLTASACDATSHRQRTSRLNRSTPAKAETCIDRSC
jgi:hypothetical protein